MNMTDTFPTMYCEMCEQWTMHNLIQDRQIMEDHETDYVVYEMEYECVNCNNITLIIED